MFLPLGCLLNVLCRVASVVYCASLVFNKYIMDAVDSYDHNGSVTS